MQRTELRRRTPIAYFRRFLVLFWNDDERRLRAPWRLLIVTGLWFALLGIPATLFSLRPGETGSPIGRLTLYFLTLALLATGLIWIAGRVLDRRYFAEFGFHLNREWWTDFGFGVAVGFVLVSSIFLLGVATGSLTIVGTFETGAGSETPIAFGFAFLAAVVLYTAVGIEEELAYRGYILTNAAEGLNGWRGLTPTRAIVLAGVVSSILFGLSHLPNPNASAVGVLGIAVGGLVIAAAYVLTGELAIPIGVHVAWNVSLGAVFGFPTSGLDYGVHVFEIRATGPSFVTGGAFGPEAGILLFGTCLVGFVLLVGWLRVQYGPIRIQRRIAASTLRWREPR